MANSDFIHVTDIVTGKSGTVPRDHLELFPTLVETDPDEQCADCAIIEPVEELASQEGEETTPEKGKKK